MPAQMFPKWFAETEGPNAWAYMWRGRFAEIYHEWLVLQAELQAAQERENAIRQVIRKPNGVVTQEWYWELPAKIERALATEEPSEPAKSTMTPEEYRRAHLNVQRTEELSADDEGLEPIETSPLTEREPDL